MHPLLEIQDLCKEYRVRRRSILPDRSHHSVQAVHGASFRIQPGEVVALEGESGSGKTTIGRCVLGLEKPTSGQIRFRGALISDLTNGQFLPLRRHLQMVFQDSFRSLNPLMTMGQAIDEPLRLLTNMDRRQRALAVRDMLEQLGLAESLLSRYRHELSGGQRQRANIARALVVKPTLVILDE